MTRLSLSVNAISVELDIDPETPLLWVLRDALNLTGTKFGCGMGLCGACTVHLDGHVFLADQHSGEPFWCVNIASARSVYCDFRSYTGLRKHVTAMLKLISQAAPEKLVIDLRDNGGGDYTVGERNLIRPVKGLESINRKGHLFVLIGAQTFSAAMNNAAQFRAQTAATLVGVTIGEKPNSFQEPREMRLPNSKLVVRYSTRWYAFVESAPNTIEPDVPVPQLWADYADGQDSALNYVLALSDRAVCTSQLSGNVHGAKCIE